MIKQLVGEPTNFTADYRVTGIREGYEDKDVVRQINETQRTSSAAR